MHAIYTMQSMNFFTFRENFSVLLGIEVRAMNLCKKYDYI